LRNQGLSYSLALDWGQGTKQFRHQFAEVG
jgi:hypothetical protein